MFIFIQKTQKVTVWQPVIQTYSCLKMDGKVVKMKYQKEQIINKDHKVQITIQHQKDKAFKLVIHHRLTEFGNIINRILIKMCLEFHIFIVIIHLILQIQIIKDHNQPWTELMVQLLGHHKSSWLKVTKSNSNISCRKGKVKIITSHVWLTDHLKQYCLGNKLKVQILKLLGHKDIPFRIM